MKNVVWRILITFFVATAAPAFSGSPNRDSEQEIQNRLIGAGRLAWLEDADADGTVHRADCPGLLVYTRDAHMSVQVMYRNPQTGGQAGPVQNAQGGYEASFGTYQVDRNSHTFTFHVEGVMVRSLIGTDLSRAYEISGKQLIVKSTNPTERWRAAWEHY